MQVMSLIKTMTKVIARRKIMVNILADNFSSSPSKVLSQIVTELLIEAGLPIVGSEALKSVVNILRTINHSSEHCNFFYPLFSTLIQITS